MSTAHKPAAKNGARAGQYKTRRNSNMAEAAKIMVSPDEVHQTAEQMSNDVVRYRDSYTNVYKASDVLKNHWEGRDVTRFHEKLASYKQVLVKMEDVINKYITYLHKAEGVYREQLKNNLGIADKLPDC